MQNNQVVLDIETSDPWINQGRGSGWPEKQAEFLCGCTYSNSDGYLLWQDPKLLIDYLNEFTGIIAHEASYEMGVMYSYGLDIEKFEWTCTRILGVLNQNNLLRFNLDELCKLYLGISKNDDETIGRIGKELGLISSRIKLSGQAAKRYHMKAIYEAAPDEVMKYNKQDVVCGYKLHEYLIDNLQPTAETITFYSDLMKALCLSRARGMYINKLTLLKVRDELNLALQDTKNKLQDEIENCGGSSSLNFGSPKQLSEFFIERGFELPLTNKGFPSTDEKSLKTIDHPVAKLILEYRAVDKLLNTYVYPYIELDAPVIDGKYIKIYPEVRILGASRTGRCSSDNPNIQNIPKRKGQGGKIRNMFEPEPGHQFLSLDYSGQELRLMVDTAYKLQIPGIQEIVDEFNKDPKFDIHKIAADIIGIQRHEAKEFILGMPYGLSVQVMAEKLGISVLRAQNIRKDIHERFPFLDKLFRRTKNFAERAGYIKDINNRIIRIDKKFEKDANNRRTQGSAAYQLNKAIVDCYRQGIIITAPIHDELIMTIKDASEIQKVKDIMENAVQLVIPCVVEYKTGLTWGSMK